MVDVLEMAIQAEEADFSGVVHAYQKPVQVPGPALSFCEPSARQRA